MSKMKEEAARLAAAALDPGLLPTLPRRKPRVAMNAVTDFTGELSRVESELAKANARLREHEESFPTRLVDPQQIKWSRFANRTKQSFEDRDFAELREEIKNAGGNVQPIKVRAVGDGEYELAFGHRRHRACLELSIPVLAMIADMSDKELFEEMSRENEARKDLSPFELAVHYKRGIEAKLYKNWAEVAASLGKSRGLMSRYSALADLPNIVVEAFPSPNDIQPKWALKIRQVLDSDSDAVVRAAKDLRQKGLSAKDVFETLINRPPKKFTRVNFGNFSWEESGSIVRIDVKRTHLSSKQLETLQALLKETLGVVPEE